MLVGGGAAAAVILLTGADGGGEWIKEEGVRLENAISTSTVRLPDGNYRMYCTAMGTIKSAISSDGLNFSVEEGDRIVPGNPGELDSTAVANPSVIQLSNGEYRMYYSGRDGSQFYGADGKVRNVIRIFSAISSDGLNFTKEGLVLDSTDDFDRGIADVPDVIELPAVTQINGQDAKYLMYYVYDWETDNSLHGAISPDGLSWTKVSLAGFSNDCMDPDVIKTGTGYRLFFAKLSPVVMGKLCIYSATSTDGINFTIEEGITVRPTEPREGIGVGDPDLVLLPDGTYRMYYYGMFEDETSQVLSAKSP